MSRLSRVGAMGLALALLLGVAAAGPALLYAQEVPVFESGGDVLVTNGTLQLREAAGLDAEVLDVLDQATRLTVVGGPESVDGVNWYQVRTGAGDTGWVSAMYLEEAPPVLPQIGDTIVVELAPLNLRDAATEDGAIIGQLEADDTALVVDGPVEAGDFVWFQIETEDGEQAWVAADFISVKPPPALEAGTEVTVTDGPLNLRESASVDAEVIETLDDGATATIVSGPVVGGEYDWYEITVSSGETGFAVADFLLADEEETAPAGGNGADFPIGSFVFADGEVDVRLAGMVDSVVVTTLEDGAVATITEGPIAADDFTWFEITLEDGEETITGWVPGEEMTGGIVLGTDAQVADGPLNLRAEASTDADALAKLETGDIVNIVSGPEVVDGVAWFEIAADDETGFVAGRYLGAAEEAESATLEP